MRRPCSNRNRPGWHSLELPSLTLRFAGLQRTVRATSKSRDFMDIQMLSILRAAHILAAALWLGAGALLTLYIMPSIRCAGAAGGAVIAESMRRGLGIFMASTAGTTILTGLLLYWIWFGARGA